MAEPPASRIAADASPVAAPASAIAAPAKANAADKSQLVSTHHFEAPPASAAPKELEQLLHGKDEQNYIFGVKREFFFLFLFIIFAFVAGYFFVGSKTTY
ncbi:MAG: hypothetical protein FJY29_12025 [Betaproteobacteria bacterium]|nr:hypothetical protein [Betaproteobacteria bacterium]